PTDGETVLVDPIAVSEGDEVAEAHFSAADPVRELGGEAGTLREQGRRVSQPVGLANGRLHAPAGPIDMPICAVRDTRAVFDTVVAGEAVEGETVAVFQVDGPRIFVGDRQVADRGAGDELNPRCEALGSTEV